MKYIFLILFTLNAGAAEKCVVMDRTSKGIIGEFEGKCSRAGAPEKYKDRINFIISQDKNFEKKEAARARLKAAAPGQNQIIQDIIELLVADPEPFEDIDDLLPIPPKPMPIEFPPQPEVPGETDPVPPIVPKEKGK